MRVALVSHNVVQGKGQGRVNYELTRHLLTEDIQVTLIANDVGSSLVEAGADWIPIEVGPVSHAVDLVKVWRFKRKADRLLRRIGSQFDAILACGVVLSVPHTVNAVHFVHSAWRQSPYHPIQHQWSAQSLYQWTVGRLNDYWERQTLEQADFVVSVSDKVRREIIDLGLPADRVQTIHNGVDLRTFRPGPADRAHLGLPEEVPLAFFAGDIQSRRKNLDTVLRALQRTSTAHLGVAGRLPGSPYPALARELGIEDRVHFLGFRRDIPDLMRAADFFVFPSRYEACTLVLLEAMASGLPVITAASTGGAELVEEDNGFVLQDPENVDQLTTHLDALAQNGGLQEEMGTASRRIAEQYSWASMSESYLDTIQRLSS
jgi:glycosyltransferase involved in cell wall biosynthesis